MSDYVQIAILVLGIASIVMHKLHHDKLAALADQAKAQLGGTAK